VVEDLPAQANRWELYRVLSEPVRLRLLALTAEEELAVGELAELLGESQPNVSRHVAPLRQAGLVVVRKHGTRTLLRASDDASSDVVVADALASGRSICEAEGSLARIAEVVRTRDSAGREFFARPGESTVHKLPSELGAYLRVLRPLMGHASFASFAIDAGTGDGGLLDVLAPVFERVVAIDRSAPQIARARERATLRGYDNVDFVLGDLDDVGVVKAAGEGADAVFAVRVLHHAPRPAAVMEKLADLCRVGGAVVVLDYAAHEDESMRDQADLWLGFEPFELSRFARSAGLSKAEITRIPDGMSGRGPDAHLAWQVMAAWKLETKDKTKRVTSNGGKAKHHG
jgi:DNA-binding transcriptional ArsR family regulator